MYNWSILLILLMVNVLLDMGKLKNPNSGLGQFSYYYGKHITQIEMVMWKLSLQRDVGDGRGLSEVILPWKQNHPSRAPAR